ncbi:hypothetical protein GCM10020254_80140 [Streptomyces goshikiensis]
MKTSTRGKKRTSRRTPARCSATPRPLVGCFPYREIRAEPAAAASARGRQVLARFPDAEIVPVDSHWGIPDLHGNAGNVDRWVRIKSEVLVLGEKKTLTTRPNGRSADWIAPGPANGCAMACAYCYVPRRKGYANPITVFTNIERIIAHISRHVARIGSKTVANQCDPTAWVYDVGENSDCSVDALISDNVADIIRAFARWPSAKASFATKFVNPDLLPTGPARTDPRALLRDAAGGLQAARHPHQRRGEPYRRRRGLPGSGLRGPLQPLSRRTAPGLGIGLGPPPAADGRRPAGSGEGTGGC